jgi:putative phosphoribosyl transferase
LTPSAAKAPFPVKTPSPARERTVRIPAGRATLSGILAHPHDASGLVIFAHGSGSGRFSPRNAYVAGVLQQGGLATLLIDLLEENEAEDRRTVFDIDLLAGRLSAASEWAKRDAELGGLRIGYFGASTGAGAALQAAAVAPHSVAAVVSRGGRPDLAEGYLPDVHAPTLLIVGGLDGAVIELNRAAFAALGCTKELIIVPGATHLFEEPGTLEQVAHHARGWFERFLLGRPASAERGRRSGSGKEDHGGGKERQ